MINRFDILEPLEQLAQPRDPFLSTSHYFFARTYIQQYLEALGEVERHCFTPPFATPFQTHENIILRLPGNDPGANHPIIIGAHYDTVPNSPGADDNASGIAVLLALAKVFSDRPLRVPIQIIAFDLEEYGMLGSEAYVKTLQQHGEKVRLMMSLEMLGYTNDDRGSQSYPPGLKYFYPNQGNFIALIGNLTAIASMRRIRKSIRGSGAKCEWLPVPFKGKPLPQTRLSDHSPFWDNGTPALMVTDTAFLRNPHYHKASDRIETLNLDFMVSIANGLEQALRTFS